MRQVALDKQCRPKDEPARAPPLHRPRGQDEVRTLISALKQSQFSCCYSVVLFQHCNNISFICWYVLLFQRWNTIRNILQALSCFLFVVCQCSFLMIEQHIIPQHFARPGRSSARPRGSSAASARPAARSRSRACCARWSVCRYSTTGDNVCAPSL